MSGPIKRELSRRSTVAAVAAAGYNFRPLLNPLALLCTQILAAITAAISPEPQLRTN